VLDAARGDTAAALVSQRPRGYPCAPQIFDQANAGASEYS